MIDHFSMMIHFYLNDRQQYYPGDPGLSLLSYLRDEAGITSVKDGCSGEGVCGACTIEIDGRPRLACKTTMGSIQGSKVLTLDGLPGDLRVLLADLFAEKGAVQCGFCSPGFLMRVKGLFDRIRKPNRSDIIKAIRPNICRCTGYVKIVDAVEAALAQWENETMAAATGLVTSDVSDSVTKQKLSAQYRDARIGARYPKYQAFETALGVRPFVDDIRIDDLLHGVLRFSDHPRARVLQIDSSQACSMPGVVRVFTAEDIPGSAKTGLIFRDWPLMVALGQCTGYIGDVVALVVAESESIARKAAEKIVVAYEVMNPISDMHVAATVGSPRVHNGRSNVLESCNLRQGNVEKAFKDAAYVAEGIYETQRVEHAFLETESAIALPEGDGIRLYSQSQGIYVDQRQLSDLLNLPLSKIRVTQVANGGGFGGKEDLSVQGHAALAALLLQKPVKVHLTRKESILMHPKRHPIWMHIALASDKEGALTALRLKAIGDTGAYASVGTKVMERVVGHATGAYRIPEVDIEALTVYTNNIPSGAMRGFGVPQITFALESCIDEICHMGGFDRWLFRYNNALDDGSVMSTGQRLSGVGLKQTLLAVKDQFYAAKYAGIACGIKNTGVGNGMTDESEVVIEVVSDKKILIHHGWTEMGQGVHTIAIQTLYQETGIEPDIMEVITDTIANIPTGMTTSSRATALLGNAIIDAARRLKNDMDEAGQQHGNNKLLPLAGRKYKGKYVCDWTSKPGSDNSDPYIHFAYGYATQLVILDQNGTIQKVIAAHDAGKVMNQVLFEGQIEGAIHMGLGYALSENLPMAEGRLISDSFRDLGILRADKMPQVEVIGIEQKDVFGPYGAKGIGEIGMVPTAAAVANAYAIYDGIRRMKLPLEMIDKTDGKDKEINQ